MATGCLSVPQEPPISGHRGILQGHLYSANRWPHDGVSFTGLRVGVIGTGSSAIQSIPVIAQQPAPPYGVPAHPDLQRAREERAR